VFVTDYFSYGINEAGVHGVCCIVLFYVDNVLFHVLFDCVVLCIVMCVNVYYCHRVSTQLQLNISYHSAVNSATFSCTIILAKGLIITLFCCGCCHCELH
jgi:hypothetical protein